MLIITNKKLLTYLGKKRINWIEKNLKDRKIATQYHGYINAIESYNGGLAWGKLKEYLVVLDRTILKDK